MTNKLLTILLLSLSLTATSQSIYDVAASKTDSILQHEIYKHSENALKEIDSILNVIYKKPKVNPIVIRASLMFISGMADGTAETLRINYSDFRDVFPNANEEYWNPNISWHNKWKNGDINQGEKFLFSSRGLVFTTDGYHQMRMIRNVTMITAITIPIGKPKKFKEYIFEGGIYYLSYTLGFTTTFDLIFKHGK